MSLIYIQNYWIEFIEVATYCIWEVKEEISSEEFQKFINIPLGQVFAIDALMNMWKSSDISLIDGQTPHPTVFYKQLSWIS